MSELAGYSPNFKKPSEVMRLRKKRRLNSGEAPSAPVPTTAAAPGGLPTCPAAEEERADRRLRLSPAVSTPRSGIKRRNPFVSIGNSCRAVPGKGPRPVDPVCGEEEGSPPCAAGGGGGAQLLTADFKPRSKSDSQVNYTKRSDDILEGYLNSQEQIVPVPIHSQQNPIELAEAHSLSREFPADWSLKTRLLFTSPHPFNWTGHLKASEESMGLMQHCRASVTDFAQNIVYTRLLHDSPELCTISKSTGNTEPLPLSLGPSASLQIKPEDLPLRLFPLWSQALPFVKRSKMLPNDPGSCTELRCAFQQSLVYWLHPSLPWISLFPRIRAEKNITSKNNPWSHDEGLQQVLMGEWSLSFSSLYNLLRAKLCPYFYLCTHQFTVLFRAAGIAGSDIITAVISPTTSGLREAMKNEGISFSLPLVEDGGNGSQRMSEPTDLGTKEERKQVSSSDEEDDGGFSWLEEMGVQDKIKKPDAMSIKLRKDHSVVRMDHKPESVVLVKGLHTFTLLNFMINSKSIVAGAGPQAGLTPTLLAPTAFRGATMHTLKARSINIRARNASGMKDSYSLEITGPIMPNSLHALTLMLKSAQGGKFTANLYTHEPTSVFNIDLKLQHCKSKELLSKELSNSGLHPATLEKLMEEPVFGKSCIRYLEMDDYRYAWKS